MAIKAPFRFARINRKVYFPDWGHLVSHDVPFKDGYCGEISLSIETQTPLLVGGKRTSGSSGASGTVEPFVNGDGNWAIPGSSIQGMIRQILEVAAFGKLGPNVKNQRFGVRDISGSETGRELYQARMTSGNGQQGTPVKPSSKTGWMIRTSGGAKIVPCEMARIKFNQIMRVAGLQDRPIVEDLLARTGIWGDNDQATASKDAPRRYSAVIGARTVDEALAVNVFIEHEVTENHTPGQMKYTYCRATNDHEDATEGTLVITGKASVGNGANRKHSEFVFHGPDRRNAPTWTEFENVPATTFEDFLLIHEADTGRNAKANPNWAFWKPHFEKGEPVPVFYLEEERDGTKQITAIGTAQMFKLAMSLSTHEMLRHSSKDHADREKFDLPSLIFGAIGGSDQKDSWFAHGLKRRAAFDLFKGNPRDTTREKVTAKFSQTLLAPKPNYYPIYVRQNGPPNLQRPYSAYHSMPHDDAALHSPELAGVKIWPSSKQTRLAQTDGQPSISNKLKTVPIGESFTGSLRVHNLRAVELGALLWALTYGEEGMYTHRLGGGKPLGLGEIRIKVEQLRLHSNMRDKPIANTKILIQVFVDQMIMSVGEHWLNSAQIKALLQAATPRDSDYRYVEGRGHAGYKEEREARHIFDDYAPDGFEPARGNEKLVTAQQQAKQQKMAQVELAKLAAEATQPHLAFKEHIPATVTVREEPPTEFAGHPPADAFVIGERVTLSGGEEAVVIGYPALRSHPAEIKKTKWLVGFTNASGKMIVEVRKQSEIVQSS
jgi:CRISPR-associated protein (TIGR03986 family)